jgi:hypothetical protein
MRWVALFLLPLLVTGQCSAEQDTTALTESVNQLNTTLKEKDGAWKVVLSGVVGIVGTLVGLLVPKILKWRRRPILKLEIEHDKGCLYKLPLGESEKNRVFVRIIVRNVGHEPAKNCRGFLVGMERFVNDKLERLDYLDVIQLNWAAMAGVEVGGALDH